MNTTTLLEIIIILFSMRENFWLGCLVFAYVAVRHAHAHDQKQGAITAFKALENQYKQENENTKNRLDAVLEEIKDEEQIGEDFVEQAETAQFFVNYNNYIIEDYGGWYVVKYPDGKTHPKMFRNIEHAKQVIDRMASGL